MKFLRSSDFYKTTQFKWSITEDTGKLYNCIWKCGTAMIAASTAEHLWWAADGKMKSIIGLRAFIKVFYTVLQE